MKMPVFDLPNMTPGLSNLLYWFRDSRKINEWALDPAMVKGVIGPPGSGKSEIILVDHFTLTREYPGIQQFVYRSTRADAVASIAKDMQKYFWPCGLKKCYDSQNDIFRWDNGSLTYFRGFDEVKTKDRYGSINYAIGWMAEAHMLREADFETILERIRQPGRVKIGVRWDAVNKFVDESHWIYRRIIGNSDIVNYRTMELQFVDNEANYREMGRGDYVDMRHREVEGDPVAIALNLEGKLPIAAIDGCPVYPEYRPKQTGGAPWHYFPGAIKVLPGIVHRGWDVAATTNYMACTFWQRQQGRCVVLKSIYLVGGSVRQLGEKVLQVSADMFPGQGPEDFVDRGDAMMKHAERITGENMNAMLELSRMGIRLLPGVQEESVRRAVVKDALLRTVDGGPMIIVAGTAKEFHLAMSGGFHMKKTQDGKYLKPVKDHSSHLVEAFEHSFAFAQTATVETNRPASKRLKIPTFAKL